MRAFLFPGQGAQYVGMGRSLYERHAVAREVFQEADAALGFSLSTIIFEGPAERLRQTEITQPAILTVSLAAWRVLDLEGIACDVAAGLSLGEYAAHVVAGSLEEGEAVRLVHERGRFMQEAVPLGRGSMVAVLGLGADVVESLCAETEGLVEPANYNCPGQIVVAGESTALAQFASLAKERGARRVQPLDVSAPFHSSMLQGAERKLRPLLEAVPYRPGRLPVVANLTAAVTPSDRQSWIDHLAGQVDHPVRWEESMRTLLQMGVTNFLEIGPGKTLAGFLRRIEKTAMAASIGEDHELEGLLESLREVC